MSEGAFLWTQLLPKPPELAGSMAASSPLPARERASSLWPAYGTVCQPPEQAGAAVGAVLMGSCRRRGFYSRQPPATGLPLQGPQVPQLQNEGRRKSWLGSPAATQSLSFTFCFSRGREAAKSFKGVVPVARPLGPLLTALPHGLVTVCGTHIPAEHAQLRPQGEDSSRQSVSQFSRSVVSNSL